MATRKALGRGLSALIPPTETEPLPVARTAPPEEEAGPLYVSVDRIAPNARQPRKRFPELELKQLAASIREQGMLQPVVLRRQGDGYELIVGERRWKAARQAGLKEVPALVLDASDRAAVEIALVENVQREDLNAMELAEAFQVLTDEEQMTQEEVGRRVGLDRSTVANHLRLLELPETVQRDIIDGRLTMGHAKAILQAPADQRLLIRDEIVRTGLSVRASEEASRRAASLRHKPGRTGRPVRDVHLVDLEERLQRDLQTRVRIVGRKDRGRIEVHFSSQAELDRLVDVLLGGET